MENKPYSIALLLYGGVDSGRDALSEEKYKALADAFCARGFSVASVLYSDERQEDLYPELLAYDIVLVWVNPIEQGKDRRSLDTLLARVADQGCLVSAHPEVILKMGTKEVLFRTKDMDWGGDIRRYACYKDFEEQFPRSLGRSGVTVLKQSRGNGGNGVFKIVRAARGGEVSITPAGKGAAAQTLHWTDFLSQFRPYFSQGGTLIEQQWNSNHCNGMVRCYLSGNKVAGFGYQEINALYAITGADGTLVVPPSARYYFTENCGLFSDLKEIMEAKWVPELQQRLAIPNDTLPVIWDADFFINRPGNPTAIGKYSLCEINVSSVSPFPPSAIPFVVKETADRIQAARNTRPA